MPKSLGGIVCDWMIGWGSHLMMEIPWHMGVGNLMGCLRSWCMILVGDDIGCIHNVWCEVGSDTPTHCPRWPIDLFVFSLPPHPSLFLPNFGSWGGKWPCAFWCNLSFWKPKKENNTKGDVRFCGDLLLNGQWKDWGQKQCTHMDEKVAWWLDWHSWVWGTWAGCLNLWWMMFKCSYGAMTLARWRRGRWCHYKNNIKCKSSVDDGIGCIGDVRCGVCSAPPSHIIAKLACLPPPFSSSFLSNLKQKRTSPSGEHNGRARPLTLHPHLHFYIRDADADAGTCPTQPGIKSNVDEEISKTCKTSCISSIYAGSPLST